jgi:hypothetical protein
MYQISFDVIYLKSNAGIINTLIGSDGKGVAGPLFQSAGGREKIVPKIDGM